jgi:hypothetical protein
MKLIFSKKVCLLLASIMIFVGETTFANSNNSDWDNLLAPIPEKEGHAKLDLSSFPLDKEIFIRIRDNTDYIFII